MKTLTTFAAIVALVAGVSVASAAGMSKDSYMGKSTMSKSARVIGTSSYCVKTKSGDLNCKFASLSACQDDANGATCTANPHTSTTGSK